MTQTAAKRVSESLRIVWAIVAKDVVDALKNKNTLSNIVVVLFTVAAYQMLPAWLIPDEPPFLPLYDAGDSSLPAALENSSALDSRQYASLQLVKEKVAVGDEHRLGLVIPADFDRVVASGGEPVLEGYVIYWIGDSAVTELKEQVESEIASLVGRPVHINLEGNQVYLPPDPVHLGSSAYMAATALVLALALLGMTVTPHLMLEEKQTRTIDILLVSPASSGHIVIGKALTGLFYCLACAALVLALNRTFINLWDVAILAAIAGSLFAVSVGLLMGMIFEDRKQFTIWGFGAMVILLWPVFLSLLAPILPDALDLVVSWVPTVSILRLSIASFAASVSPADVVPALLYVLAWTFFLLAIVAWLVRRSDR
jgi:ABC-type Na+ efflux pump permease subunit